MPKLSRCMQKATPVSSFSFGLLLMLVTGLVGAEVHTIRAVFQPDSANPLKNEFVNQTPSEGFCGQVGDTCKNLGLFSLVARVPFVANAPILANHADPRQGGMAKVPSEWRTVTVTHEDSGDTQPVEIRIAGIGHELALPLSVREITGGQWWNELWEGGSWAYAPRPCGGVGIATGGEHAYNSFWTVPENAGICSKKAKFDIPLAMSYQYFVYGYQLRTPNPLDMKSGDYTGSITYSIGPKLDFDMGDVMVPAADSSLTLNFLLNVKHTLKVDTPPGSNRIDLEPQGGWHAWLQNGRKPTRIFKDQLFNISASSPFTMKLECNFVDHMNQRCIMFSGQSESGPWIPLDVSVSLPHGLVGMDGKTVNRHPVKLFDSAKFQPGFYVDNKPGVLHFEIAADRVADMIDAGESRHYYTPVTVVWDSDI